MTNLEAKNTFNKILNEWSNKVVGHFQDNIVGILRFGSTTKEHLKHETDIDIMFVFSQLPKNRRHRFQLLNELELKLNEQLKNQLPDYQFVLSPLFRTPEDLNIFSPLFLDMLEFSIIHFDKDGLLKSTLQRTKDWVQQSGAYKTQHGTKWYWVLNPSGINKKIEW